MDNKMTKFGLNKSEAIKFIFELQQLVHGHVKIKRLGICDNIDSVVSIDYYSIFSILKLDDLFLPIGGIKEYSKTNLWEGESLLKRVALCKQMKNLMQETFNIKDKG